MIIYVDIDNTICKTPPNRYDLAKPMKDRIEKVNNLHKAGNKIVYWTARGTTTGKDWAELTEKQLKKWGCKYHVLEMGKPDYDAFIDDKAFNADNFFNLAILKGTTK